jgi:hypothetical protein
MVQVVLQVEKILDNYFQGEVDGSESVTGVGNRFRWLLEVPVFFEKIIIHSVSMSTAIIE